MTLGIRKLIVIILVASIFLLANVFFVVNWLDKHGVVDWAKYIRSEYITGTAITIVIALLILLVRPGYESGGRSGLLRRCPVCDHVQVGKGKYCSECGSKQSGW